MGHSPENEPRYGGAQPASELEETQLTPDPVSSDRASGQDLPTVQANVPTQEQPRRRLIEPGTVLAQRFVIRKFLGGGGMGEVYEAEDLQLDHARIALKTIRSDQLWRGHMRQLFRQEVLLARSISHPNVCPVYELFTSVGPYGELGFLTMKLLSGETLAERLGRMSPLSMEDVLRFGRHVADALDSAHQAGIVHRDLKPANIILELALTGARAVVTDFGLARSAAASPQSGGEDVVGTPAYIAPEVLNGEPASAESDVYAFGVVLHEMVFGVRPDPAGGMDWNASLDPRRRPLQPAIRRCFHPKREQRYASAGAAMDALEAAWRGAAPVFTRRRLVAGAATLAAGALGVEWFGRDGSDIENLLHPVPRPRRVAILPDDGKGHRLEDTSLVNGVLERVGAELSRAEAVERDLFVVQPRVLREQKIDEAAGALGLFGTNLVLQGSLTRDSQVVLILQLLASSTGRLIRSAKVSCALASLSDLPRLAIAKASQLLEVHHRPAGAQSAMGDTMNAEAYAAFERGREWLRQYGMPNVDKAIAELQKAVDLDPQFARAWAILSEAYSTKFFLGKEPEALDLAERNCNRALAIAPDLPMGYSRRAIIENYRGNSERATADLQRAFRLDPDDPDTQIALADAFWRSGKVESADQTYRKLIDQRPNNWLALNNWGDSYFGRANYKKAEELFRQATMAAPQAALPWRNLGAVGLAAGKFDLANRALNRSIALLPSGEAYTNLGTVFFWQNRFIQSAEAYRKATELSPNRFMLWGNLGDALSMLPGRAREARRSWQKAADLAEVATQTNPSDAEAWGNLALFEAKLGRGPEALAILHKTDFIHKPNVEQLFREVLIYELAGDRRTALLLLQRCLKSGYSAADIVHAPELANLRKDPRFKRVAATS